MSYDIGEMTLADLDVALGWARAEGWNPGLADAAPFHATDPSGFLMGWLDGEPVSSISVVKYGETFAFLGLYIVRPEFRGRGLGRAIWDAGIASAGARSIGLDGVVAQQENYRHSGFAWSHANARWGGALNISPPVAAEVRPIAAADIDAVVAYDRELFGVDRGSFIAGWLAADGTRQSFGYAQSDGSLGGYASIRRCAEGYKIGPLFADAPAIAEALIAACAGVADGAKVTVDIPAPNAAAVAMARSLGLTPSFETARMYRGDTAPRLPLGRIYGVTTLELG